tara:strand:+ start:496 stop:717 length:222 start_codon:yes stop_codon:yes gene_type:complete
MMNWNEIMRKGGIPESPGREQAAQMHKYRAVFREKKTGLEQVLFLEAMSLHGAMRKLKGRTQNIVSLVRWTDP